MTQQKGKTCTQKFNDIFSLLLMWASKYGKQPMKTKRTSPDNKLKTVKICCWKSVERWMAEVVARFVASVQRTWCTLIQILHILWWCTNPHSCSQQAKFVCIMVTMLTTVEVPMCKCSSWHYGLLCCQLDTLNELSVWQTYQFKCSQFEFELCGQQSSLPWIGLCGGAAFCCHYTGCLVKLHLGQPWGCDAWGWLDPLMQMGESTKKASKCKLT